MPKTAFDMIGGEGRSVARLSHRARTGRRALKPEDADWKQIIVRGQPFFDASEYEFSRQIKLTEYVSLRDEAFSSYQKASEIYAAKVPDMAKG